MGPVPRPLVGDTAEQVGLERQDFRLFNWVGRAVFGQVPDAAHQVGDLSGADGFGHGCLSQPVGSMGLRVGVRGGGYGDGAAGDVGECGHAEAGGASAAGGDLVHLGEFGAGADETDFEAFGLAEPVVLFGFGDAFGQVVADLDQAGSLGGIWSKEWAS
jgi:hypothetical protein